MTSSPSSFDAFLKQFIRTLPPGLAEFKKDLEHHAKITLNHGLKELDLVTRQEFDTQRRVLQKTRHMLEALNERLDTLEGHQSPKRKPSSHSTYTQHTPPKRKPAASKAQRKPAARKPAARKPSAYKPDSTHTPRKAPAHKPDSTHTPRKAPAGKSTTRPRPTRRKKT